jgi:1-acyl-sn-glycerol-3-phosphate acyltransferase
LKLIFFLRSLIGGILFIGLTILCSAGAFFETLTIGNRKIESWIISTWGKYSLKLFGVKLQVQGRENIPTGSALFLFNHASYFDILAMAAGYSDLRFGAKIELFKIPIFGHAMRRLGMLPIARARKEEVFKVYEEAKSRAQRGEKFALSPEGGRNNEEKLLPFKSGPFIFAINSGMPIVPTVIQGAHAVMGKGSLIPNKNHWTTTLTVIYLKPIPTEGFSIKERSDLQKITFQEMNSALAALQS